ncbi:hypothetical protein ACJMK2_000396 [Sinanodonta woodiana]|uniref:Doublecortin domain-containing protein n=1 Tax=Sinanodonta woodiana TaxID=1069815 RepID=A0ABD3XPL7_SINWO
MSAEMDDTYQAGYLRGYQKAFKVKLYRNNDTFFPPKEITIQQKHMNFDKFLTLCTDSVKPVFGAVRNIYTPMGRHRITKVDELKDGEAYVVAGNEKFRKHP